MVICPLRKARAAGQDKWRCLLPAGWDCPATFADGWFLSQLQQVCCCGLPQSTDCRTGRLGENRYQNLVSLPCVREYWLYQKPEYEVRQKSAVLTFKPEPSLMMEPWVGHRYLTSMSRSCKRIRSMISTPSCFLMWDGGTLKSWQVLSVELDALCHEYPATPGENTIKEKSKNTIRLAMSLEQP